MLGQGHHVKGVIALGQLVHGAKDQPVVMSIEVAIGDLIQHALPGIVVEHQATEYSLLGLDRVRRHLQGGGLQVVLFGQADVVHKALGKILCSENKRHDITYVMSCLIVSGPAPECKPT